MGTYLRTFIESLTSAGWGPNLIIPMWILVLLVVYNVFLAMKGDAKTDKLTKLILYFGITFTLIGIIIAVVIVGNPEIAQGEKILLFLGQSTIFLQPLVFALFGKILVNIIQFVKS